MSGLETQVRPILSGLMNNEAEILDCDAKAKLILARWTAKTAYVLNYASNLPTKVPSQDLRDLYKDMTTLPAGVAVFAQQHEATKDYGWLQSPTWPSLLMPKEMAGLLGQGRWIHPKVPRSVSIEAPFEDEIRDPNSYKIGLQLKSLLLLVAYHPRYLEWCYRLWKGVHIPLWPQSGQVTWEERPSEDFAAYDSEEALWRFQLSLGLTLFLDKNPYDSP